MTKTYLRQRTATKAPAFRVPPGACDCHAHIFGDPTRFPFTTPRSFTPPEAPIDEYVQMLGALGIERMVIVQPSVYGLDNSCTLDAIATLGSHRARGVIATETNIDATSLRKLDGAGVRGVRFISTLKGGASLDHLRDIANRIAPFGWHIEIYASGESWPDLYPTLVQLPLPVVIDHMGRIPANAPADHAGLNSLLRLLEGGKCWLKLCAYRVSVSGHPYSDVAHLARRFITHAPERCIWGSDWPHPNLYDYMPDDGELLDLLPDWAPASEVQHRILVDNPAALYGF